MTLLFIFSCKDKEKQETIKPKENSQKAEQLDTLKSNKASQKLNKTDVEKSQIDTVKVNYKELSLVLIRKPFERGRHKVELEKLKIDGIKYFGTDGDLPKYELSNSYVFKNGKRIDLKTDGMYNPWFGNGNNVKDLIHFTNNENGTLIFGIFSDGAGSYASEWLIYENKSKRIELSNDENFIFKYE